MCFLLKVFEFLFVDRANLNTFKCVFPPEKQITRAFVCCVFVRQAKVKNLLDQSSADLPDLPLFLKLPNKPVEYTIHKTFLLLDVLCP